MLMSSLLVKVEKDKEGPLLRAAVFRPLLGIMGVYSWACALCDLGCVICLCVLLWDAAPSIIPAFMSPFNRG